MAEMGIKDGAISPNSPQILPFPVEKQPPQLSINTDDGDIRILYINYYPMVYRRCLAILRNEENAKDMAGAVFEKLQELKTKGRLNVEFPATYLSTMAKNMSINEIKKTDRERKELIKLYDMATNENINHVRGKGEQAQKLWENDITYNGYTQLEAEYVVKAILGENDETTRRIYFYKYRDDMTLEQIGEAVGLTKSAVQKRIKALEKQVKAAMEGGGL